ncbi:unnamed protein product [Staurois parvus]|uniref:Uncharacterized protein n=1 Tax=Staurois parvus TaxID=386267 RepID=A0ABN9F3B7_9NEOB|nr:unnamed protein product [Staurois parvus]
MSQRTSVLIIMAMMIISAVSALPISAAFQCPSLLHISGASSVPPHQCPPVAPHQCSLSVSISAAYP